MFFLVYVSARSDKRAWQGLVHLGGRDIAIRNACEWCRMELYDCSRTYTTDTARIATFNSRNAINFSVMVFC